jgi:hypothetical protein
MQQAPPLDALIGFYETLSPDGVALFSRYYASDAYFKDPFNEVRGLPAIRKIFTHMFRQVAEPRFCIVERIVDAGGVMLIWEFHYRNRHWRRGEAQLVRGVTHLRFDADGKVTWHRDYWDAAEELYARLPVIGYLMRLLKKALAA